MKTKSIKLREYLIQKEINLDDPIAVAHAKKDYRTEYKRNHRRNALRKELRPLFTQRELYEIQIKAIEAHLTPTGLVKAITMTAIMGGTVIPNKAKVLEIYQLVGMAINGCKQGATEYYVNKNLIQIENKLREYLGITT